MEKFLPMSHPWKKPFFNTVEIVLLYLMIQLYIWRWQFSHRELAWPLVLCLFATHLVHRETLESLGFRFDNFLESIRLCSLVSIPFWLLIVSVGFVSGRLWNSLAHHTVLLPALRYVLWAIFQQYGLQGVFHQRLRKLMTNPWLSSVFCAFLFMSLHFPNQILMFFTLSGGFALSWVYTKQPNIFALGIIHGLLGLLLSNCFPPEILHNMRVGPGYFR
jgi:membrane protease YdiL (CAAX protease family)